MTRLAVATAILFSFLLFHPIAHGFQDSAHQPLAEIRRSLQDFTEFSPDPCGPPYGSEKDWHSAQIEDPLFEKVAESVVANLNAGTATPQDRASEALRNVEHLSAEVNAAWPDENRFHFRVLDLDAILVVEMSIRTHERFFVFGIPQTFGDKQNDSWRQISVIQDDPQPEVPGISLGLYPIHRGPSGSPRFLVRAIMSGCAGSLGVIYDAREWSPDGYGHAEQIIDLKGSLGLDDKVRGFPQIGELRTGGSTIDLPYCWFSSIDTWDNPSLCAVDRYDLSGDAIRFVSRRVNRPDLLPIAKAVEYANKRDFGAVRGYCASDPVARRLVESAPGELFEVEVKVKRLSAGRELVYDESGNYRFIVERRVGRWLITGFTIQ